MRIFLRLTLLFLSIVPLQIAVAQELQDHLTGTVQELIPRVASDNTVDYVDIAREVQFWLFVFIGIIAVGYIIYIGAKLLWAPGSTEELKTAMKSFVFIVLGLALIPLAFFIVQLIVNIRLG